MEAKQTTKKLFRPVIGFLLLILGIAVFVYADPSGTTITYNVTDTGPTASPDNKTDAGGTITTMVLDAVQQDTKWKAYVGNITGTLTLDDSNANTIFAWSLAASQITGEVYASRAASPTWASVNCTTSGTLTGEEAALGITGTDVDSIRNTFNETQHPAMTTAGRTMPADTCNATSTYVNDAKEAQASASFPIILLHDTTNMIYATPVNQDNQAFVGTDTVDFQMILADDPTVAITTYYFFAEIG